MKTVLETLQAGTAYLEKRGIESARLNMQLMLAEVLGCSKLDLYLEFDRPLEESELVPLRELLKRRGHREPLQHLLGHVEFYGREFLCDGRALIPRPETEELLAFLLKNPPEFEAGDAVADVGTGSGIIGLSLAAEWCDHGLSFHVIDQSEEALQLARENAEELELSKETLHFHHGDLLEGIDTEFRLIAANLPYIPTKEIADLSLEVQKEPAAALDGGLDGLDLIRRLVLMADQRLISGGLLALEFGLGQHEAVAQCLSDAGYQGIEIKRDMNGIDRFIVASKN